eukprot:gene7831-10637_t
MSQGYGCMGLSAFYTGAKDVTVEKAKNVVQHAIHSGVTLFNTATFYGPLHVDGFGSNLRLIKACLEGTDRSKIQLMVKICMNTRAPVDKPGTMWQLQATAKGIREDVEYALSQLGTDYIDIIVLCRVPRDIPIEESILGMKAMVDEGKARYIGISEADAATIRRAQAVHPLYCIEQEWSLWSRDIEEEIVPCCRELGIKIVAYSPLGRGFLTGSYSNTDSLDPTDFRRLQPKFTGENLANNVELLNNVQAVADRKGITVGQLALAWLHAKGPDVIPIPGTTSVHHFDQNYSALNIVLSIEELTEIDSIFHIDAAKGERYAHNHLTFHTLKETNK